MDIKIIESLNGGELELSGNDLATVNGVENTPYLAMFGGESWCLNFLTNRKFKCETEKTLNTVTLNSAGRMAIQQAVNNDLSYLNSIPGTTWAATVTITGPNSVKIGVNIDGKQFDYLWNPEDPTPVRTIVSICPVVTGLAVSGSTSTTITFGWTASGAPSYQYAYNTTGDSPEPAEWIDTTDIEVTITGLTEGVDYFIFVRTVCADGLYSAAVDTSVTTPLTPPAPPVTSGLILSLWSTIGVDVTGPNVEQWNDQSGNGNHLLPSAGAPQLSSAMFGTKPGIIFDNTVASQTMVTAGNLAGLTGDAATTVFIVTKFDLPVSTTHLAYYSDTPSSITAGEWESYTQAALGGTMTCLVKGNVGTCAGYVLTPDDVAKVYTLRMDFAKAAVAELKMLKNDSDADFTLTTSAENTGTFAAAQFGVGEGKQDIAAVLMYDRNLTPEEETDTVDYLKTYFSVV